MKLEESGNRVKNPQVLQRHEMLRGKTTANSPPTSKTDIQDHDSRCDQKTGQDGKLSGTNSNSKKYKDTGCQQTSTCENVPHDCLLLQFARENGCESPENGCDCNCTQKSKYAHGATHSIRCGTFAARECQNYPEYGTKHDW
jgi:hypothetical protein